MTDKYRMPLGFKFIIAGMAVLIVGGGTIFILLLSGIMESLIVVPVLAGIVYVLLLASLISVLYD